MTVVMVMCFNKSFATSPVDVANGIVDHLFEDNQGGDQVNMGILARVPIDDNNFCTRSNTPNITKFPTFVKDGNVYAQYWYATALPPHQLSQQISGLSNGQYTLRAMIGVELYTGESISGVNLFAGEAQSPVTETGGKDVVVNTVVTDGTLTIGYRVERGSNAKFVIIDNFRLEYNGEVTDINQANSNSVTVYPTITQGAVMVNTLSAAEIHLSDITGKTIDNYNSPGGAYKFDISNRSNGIYFVTVITENKKTVCKILKR